MNGNGSYEKEQRSFIIPQTVKNTGGGRFPRKERMPCCNPLDWDDNLTHSWEQVPVETKKVVAQYKGNNKGSSHDKFIM